MTQHCRISDVRELRFGPLPDGRRLRQNRRKQSFHIEISRSALIGSFRNANQFKYSLCIGRVVMLFA